MLQFVCYPKCTTCQKAKKWLDDNNIQYEFRDIKLNNPSLEELEKWYKQSGLPLKNKLPQMAEQDMLELLATDGMLVKRPLLIGADFTLVGFTEAEWKEKL